MRDPRGYFYSDEEFYSQVQDLTRQGHSESSAQFIVEMRELSDRQEYEAWLDRQMQEADIYAEFG